MQHIAVYKTAQGPVLTLNTLPSGTLSARSFVKFCRDQTLNESENHRFVHMCLTKTNENIRSSMFTYTVNMYIPT